MRYPRRLRWIETGSIFTDPHFTNRLQGTTKSRRAFPRLSSAANQNCIQIFPRSPAPLAVGHALPVFLFPLAAAIATIAFGFVLQPIFKVSGNQRSQLKHNAQQISLTISSPEERELI